MSGSLKVRQLKKTEPFNELLKGLFTNNQNFSTKDKSLLLSAAILLLRKYEKDNSLKTYLELAYYIILKYSILYDDLEPLYDFATNFGFYPISNVINREYHQFSQNIQNDLLNYSIEETFKHNNIIEALEQKTTRTSFLESNYNNISYIAPTSFGKSHLIVEHIRQNTAAFNKIAIIVPKKSLLAQTYKMVKAANLGYRILVHNEMYNNDDRFIGVFTQERALRLLDKQNVTFDILYIDEAHKIFSDDSRNILLARLVKLNRIRNRLGKAIYLSPLIENSDNLAIENTDNVQQNKILFNMKEPEIFEYTITRKSYIYNRFFNEFYELPDAARNINEYNYIVANRTDKNFIYLNTPKKIELFTKRFFNSIEEIPAELSPDIIAVIENLKKYVHKDFYVTDYLKKGILYIHGKIPDNIKEYLEYKFGTVKDISYIVANNVILEGMNLPIDSLFILQTRSLEKNDLINLIGRVNRLNLIFTEDVSDLAKLLPRVHFVNNYDFQGELFKMSNKIALLKNSDCIDNLYNPTLRNFDINTIKLEHRPKYEKIINNEDIIFSVPETNVQRLRKSMLELGLDVIYDLTDEACSEISNRINNFKNAAADMHLMKTLQSVFVSGLDNFITDDEFRRLGNDEAINYYINFIDIYRQRSLKEKISSEAAHLKGKKLSDNPLLYTGISFGEVNYYGRYGGNTVYVNLSDKNDKEIVNIAIIKVKLEEDFVSFKLHKFFQLMLDYELITQEQYNLLVYGTNDESKLALVKLGLSLNIINKLTEDEQLENISIDENNNLICNESFVEYKDNVDDFFRFELDKFL